jgi:hypothetical protein
VSDETKSIFRTVLGHAKLFLFPEECKYLALHSDMLLLMLSVSEKCFQKIPPTRKLSTAQPSFSRLEMKVL